MSGKISMESVLFFVQLSLGAMTWACFVGLIYAVLERQFPGLLFEGQKARYANQPISFGLILIGFVGFVICAMLWLSSAHTSVVSTADTLLMAVWVSAAVFDIGALMFLWSESAPESA
jgi:hypothetical protein